MAVRCRLFALASAYFTLFICVPGTIGMNWTQLPNPELEKSGLNSVNITITRDNVCFTTKHPLNVVVESWHGEKAERFIVETLKTTDSLYVPLRHLQFLDCKQFSSGVNHDWIAYCFLSLWINATTKQDALVSTTTSPDHFTIDEALLFICYFVYPDPRYSTEQSSQEVLRGVVYPCQPICLSFFSYLETDPHVAEKICNDLSPDPDIEFCVNRAILETLTPHVTRKVTDSSRSTLASTEKISVGITRAQLVVICATSTLVVLSLQLALLCHTDYIDKLKDEVLRIQLLYHKRELVGTLKKLFSLAFMSCLLDIAVSLDSSVHFLNFLWLFARCCVPVCWVRLWIVIGKDFKTSTRSWLMLPWLMGYTALLYIGWIRNYWIKQNVILYLLMYTPSFIIILLVTCVFCAKEPRWRCASLGKRQTLDSALSSSDGVSYYVSTAELLRKFAPSDTKMPAVCRPMDLAKGTFQNQDKELVKGRRFSIASFLQRRCLKSKLNAQEFWRRKAKPGVVKKEETGLSEVAVKGSDFDLPSIHSFDDSNGFLDAEHSKKGDVQYVNLHSGPVENEYEIASVILTKLKPPALSKSLLVADEWAPPLPPKLSKTLATAYSSTPMETTTTKTTTGAPGCPPCSLRSTAMATNGTSMSVALAMGDENSKTDDDYAQLQVVPRCKHHSGSRPSQLPTYPKTEDDGIRGLMILDHICTLIVRVYLIFIATTLLVCMLVFAPIPEVTRAWLTLLPVPSDYAIYYVMLFSHLKELISSLLPQSQNNKFVSTRDVGRVY